MFRGLSFLFLNLLLFATDGAQSAPEEPKTYPSGAAAEPPSPDAAALAGQWDGAIDISGMQLTITVKIRQAGGSPEATIDIPQQGAVDLPLDEVSFKGNAIHFAIASAGATFDGLLDGETIHGDFLQSGVAGSFNMVRASEPATAANVADRPETGEEITLALGETKMSATMTTPEGDGPFPAVIFVAGSGPTDRNWNSALLPGHNGSAALLADELTRSGYATLRYDKRVTGPYAQQNLPVLQGKISFQSHLDELASAVDYLATQSGVDPARLYILANSEGTLHALNYQLANPVVPFAGMILTGAPGRSLAEVVHQQVDQGFLVAEPNRDELLAKWDQAITAFIAGKTVELDPDLPENIRQIWAGLTAPVNQPFSAQLLAAQPADLLAMIAVPVLVVIGQKDIQVDWQADGGVLRAAAGDNVSFSFPPDANHVLKHEEKPVADLTAADATNYNAADRVLDPEALQTILQWLAVQTN